MTYDEWIATHTTGRHVFHGVVLHWTEAEVFVRMGERVDGAWVKVEGDDGPENAGVDVTFTRAEIPDPRPRLPVCRVVVDDIELPGDCGCGAGIVRCA